MKQALRPAIVPGLMSTPATGLRGMPGINAFDADTSRLGLVLHKGVELGKAPTMQTAALLPFALGGPVADIGQVFKDDGRSWRGTLDNPFGQHMVMIFALPKLFAREFTQVAFRAPAAFGLQGAFQAEDTAFLLFPAPLSEKLADAGHSRASEAEVYPDHFRGRRNGWGGEGHHNMQAKASLAIAQISTTDFGTHILLQVYRDDKRRKQKESYMAEQPETVRENGGLKVIGAGFGRTGTLSLKHALEELGSGPCYHMSELFDKPHVDEQWDAIVSGGPADWPTIFKGYQATVDWPACSFYKELMQVYPNAKVLLTVRDPEKWYESVASTIYRVSHMNPDHARTPHGHMVRTLIWQGTFDNRFEDKDYAIGVFLRHNEEVKQHVSAEKLLVYNVKEGWEPLCAFLEVPVPAGKPFPHDNDRANFLGDILRRREQQQQQQ